MERYWGSFSRRGGAAVVVALFTVLGVGFVSRIPCRAEPPVVPSIPLDLPDELVAAERSRIAAVGRAMPATVCVFVPGGGGGGSGVLISPDGFALTNFHVSSPAGSYMRCGLGDGRVYDAVIVGVDPVGDLALIKLLGREDFPVAQIGNSRAARVGDWCMAIGNPFLLASNLQPTVSFGVLSGVGRYQYPSGTLLEYGDCLQTDAAINPGNSGGPLFDADGNLLGVIGRCSFEKRGRVNVGVGYAISVHQAMNFLGDLHSGRVVDHATLGATVQSDPDGGVRVTNILEFSDVYRRGVRYGTEILELDGRVVSTANEVQNVLATLPAGWRIKLRYRKDGKTVDTLVRLSSVHNRDELLTKMASALPPPPPAPQKSSPKQTPESPDDSDRDDPKDAPQPPGDADQKRGPGIPSVASKVIESRRGYANYHFNRTHQSRLLKSIRRHAPARVDSDGSPDRAWEIRGQVNVPGGPTRKVVIRVTDTEASMTIGQDTLRIESDTDAYNAVDRKEAVAMLVALRDWSRLVRLGTESFGEVYYRGTVPLGGERPLRDCLVGVRAGMETRWLVHPTNRWVEKIEVLADQDDDPAELWIDWEPAPGTPPPATVRGEGDEPANAIPVQFTLKFGLAEVIRIQVEHTKAGTNNSPNGAGAKANGHDVREATELDAGAAS